jgi:hypothetical protein
VPSVTLDHIHLPDPIARDLDSLHKEIRRIEEYLRKWEGGPQVSFLTEEKSEEDTSSQSSSEISQGTQAAQNDEGSTGMEQTEEKER